MSETPETPAPEDSLSENSEDKHAPAAPMSAEDLGKAFAKMLDGAAEGDSAPAEDSQGDPAGENSADVTSEDVAPPTPRQILEALLFVGTTDNEPLSTDRLCQALQGVEPAELADLVQSLNQQYTQELRPYEIVSSGGGYRMTLHREYERLRDKFYGKIRQARLSQAAIEVLAIVAYNQPIAADEVAELRGTPSGPVLSQLVRRQLLQIERTNTKPRKANYSTSDRFLDLFGLGHVSELPRPVEAQAGSPG
jgi:segregation and condensation protein B